jgi:hypothetical protein
VKNINSEWALYHHLMKKSRQFEAEQVLNEAFLNRFNALYRLITLYYWHLGGSGDICHQLAGNIMVNELRYCSESGWKQFLKLRHRIKYEVTAEVGAGDLEQADRFILGLESLLFNQSN